MDKTARAKLIVVFADIRGSSRWTRRMGEDEDARHDFMMAYDRECLFYKARTSCTFYKRLGDGRMFVHELRSGKESSIAASVLNEALGLAKRVDKIIAKLMSPRPSGFRVRLMSGTVISENYPDGELDWVGYIPNTCHKFLAVCPELPCVAQESVRELVRPADANRYGFQFTLLTGPRRCPDGVDREDVDSLFSVSYRKRS